MSVSSQFDVTELRSLDIPYDIQTAELDPRPRLVDTSTDLWVTQSGKWRRRPVFSEGLFSGITAPTVGPIDRLFVLETLDDPPKVYLLASVRHAINTDWEMYFLRVDDSPAPSSWTLMPNIRDLNDSTRAHEVVVANGKAYIMGFPASGSSEKLGTVIFDPDDETTTFWGVEGPTTPAKVTASGGWAASDNPHEVVFGWKYSYSYKTKTGQISNRAPLATAAGESSNTGAFSDKNPAFTYDGHSDTTNVTNIVIWRTTDGGGNLVKLDEITNPGSGSQTYVDNNRDGGTSDPKTDFELDTSNFAPSLTSNSVPPRVLSPLVTGTDDPTVTTPLSFYASRIWYAIGNVLFFSGQEEILNGIPFESFPSGTRGNFFRFRHPIRMLQATNEALYIITSHEVLWLRGFDRASFHVTPLASDIGGAANQPRASNVVRDVVCFLTNDNQIALIRGSEFELISFALGSTLDDEVNAGGTVNVMITPHLFEGNVWIVVSTNHRDNQGLNRLFVYDLNRQAWNPPWIARITAQVSDVVQESNTKRQFVAVLREGSNNGTRIFDIDNNQDIDPAGSATNFAIQATTSLFGVLAGNHLNALREPAHTSILHSIKLERTKFASDTDPTVGYRLNEFSGSFTTVTRTDPVYMPQSSSYQIGHYADIWKATQRIALNINKAAADESFELQTIAFVWQPEAGA